MKLNTRNKALACPCQCEVLMSTPKEAIREFCRNCVSGDIRKVSACGGDKIECPLYPVRLKEGKISVRHIRAYCLFCMLGSRELVFSCGDYTCPLSPYRLGINAKQKTRPGQPSEILQNGS